MGQQTLFLSAEKRQDSVCEMWLAGPGGDAARKVGELPSMNYSVALSPDANRLAIGLSDGVYIQSIATGERKRVQPMKSSTAVWWHPSGHSVGFLDRREEDSKTRAWQVNYDGTHLRRIVPEREQMQWRGRWSLDGKRFFYSSVEEGARNIGLWCKREGGVDRVAHSLVPRSHGTDRNLTICNLDSTARFLEKHPVPSLRFDAPRSHKDPVVHHDNPDADEAVRPGSGSGVQAFALTEHSQDVVGEMLLRLHGRTR